MIAQATEQLALDTKQHSKQHGATRTEQQARHVARYDSMQHVHAATRRNINSVTDADGGSLHDDVAVSIDID